jgi:hypothetical protein
VDIEVERQPHDKLNQTLEWNPVEIAQLQQVDNKFMCSIFLVRQYCCRIYHKICSRYYEVLQCSREIVYKRTMRKVYLIVIYFHKDITV